MPATPDADELAVRARLKELIDGPTPDAQPDAVDTAAAAAIAQPRIPAQPQPDAHPDAGGTAADEPDAQPSDKRIRNRIPEWWTGRRIDLVPEPDADAQPAPERATEPAPDADAQPVEDEPDPDEDDGDEGEPDTDAQPTKERRPRLRIPAVPRIRIPSAPAGHEALIAAPAPRMSLLEAYGRVPPRIRWLAVHTSAAAAGYRLGWVQWSTGASAWMDVHGWVNANGAVYVALAVACELLRRRARHSILPVRWAAAIPIASLVTGAALYGTGWQNLELPL